MTEPEKIEVLRVHVAANGHVWYGDDVMPAIDSGLPVQEFLTPDESGVELRRVRLVRVLGLRQNAALICGMYEIRAQIREREIRLGSPALCQTQAVLDDPSKVLQYLWQPDTPSALVQHWHPCDKYDYLTYAMIKELTADPRSVQGHGYAALHPAWPALTFIDGVHLPSARQLLVDIVDPRWFIHYWRPHRHNRLYEYLGLTPQNIAAALGAGERGRNYQRAENVLRVWRSENKKECTPDLEAPGAFLRRLAGHYPDPVKGVLRACKKLVSFVTLLWLDAVTRKQPDTGFSPSAFFHTVEEYAAFQAHRSRAR